MIGPPLPYNVHTNVHAVFHGIPAPHLWICFDFLDFHRRRISKIPDLENRCVKFIANFTRVVCVSQRKEKSWKLIVERTLPRTNVFVSFFFLVFNKRGFRDSEGMSRQDVTSRGLQRGFCGLIFRPLVQGTDYGEENNPATVRWIDTTRTYVDM